MIYSFDRFDRQCRKCSCFSDNIGPGEVFDPDCECTLNHDVGANTKCDDYDQEANDAKT